MTTGTGREGGGTVHALVDDNVYPAIGGGDTVESYRYDAWGNVLGVFDGNGGSLPSSVLGLRYLFQGREYSWATHAAWGGAGLYYFRARWYDPQTGRWLSNDPIGISGGLNQYAFCANNPVMFVDPEGMNIRKMSGHEKAYLRNFHINIEVDIHDPNGNVIGVAAFSYGHAYGAWVIGTGMIFIDYRIVPGFEYVGSRPDNMRVIAEIQTTPSQDREALQILETAAEGWFDGLYFAGFADCRTWSAHWFSAFQLTYDSSISIKRCKVNEASAIACD